MSEICLDEVAEDILQPFRQDYAPTSHITHVVRVNFIHEWRNLQFQVDSERQTYWETFSWQVYFYSQSLCQKSAQRKLPKIYFFFIFLKDYVLASHTTHVVCVNFIHEWRNLQFNVDCERQICWETFSWQVYFFSQSLCQKSAQRKSPNVILFFIFRFDALPGIRTRTLSLISQHTTY